jgi:hypothetical protein
MQCACVNIIKEGYEDFCYRVLHEGQLSDPIKTSSGVRKGRLLSPLLFLLVVDGVLQKRINLEAEKNIGSMEYAYDIRFVSHKYEHMQKKLDDLHEESKKAGLQINPLKTEEIRVDIIINRVLKLNGEEIKNSSDFCYLGSMVAEYGGASTDVNVRTQKARGPFSKLRKVWLSTSIRKETKMKIFYACVKSVLLYGCETWLVASEIRRKTQTFVNRCLRYILRIW